MAIDNVSATAATGAQLNMQDFMRILTSQLNYQDPLKPMDNTEFLAQIAQFTSLEQTRQTNEKLEALLAAQSATQSVGLLGRMVDANLGTGIVSGQVVQLTLTGDEPRLTVRLSSGTTVPDIALSQVAIVR